MERFIGAEREGEKKTNFVWTPLADFKTFDFNLKNFQKCRNELPMTFFLEP